MSPGGSALARPRVDVNLLWCVHGEVGGSEQYLVRQLLGLGELAASRDETAGAGGHEHPLAAPMPDVVVYAPQGLLDHERLLSVMHTTVAAPTDGNRRWRRIVDESTWLHRRTRGAALVHHGGGTAPTIARRPFVLTIHDLQYLTFPEYFSPLKRRYLNLTIPSSARRAALVTVPSEYVKGSVVEHLGVAADRVVVVPHGVEPALLEEITAPAVLRERYDLGDGPVIIYPAITHPHKNHRFLVDLMAGPWNDPDLRLVMIGGEGTGEAELAAAIDRAGDAVAGRIVRPGRVPTADRNGLVAMAEALVFPSRYEGFGAPVIEAMALGTPVVSADTTCLPEVVGDAGLVLPLTVAAWANALDRIRLERPEFVRRGLQRAERFTSRRSGAALTEAYASALALALGDQRSGRARRWPVPAFGSGRRGGSRKDHR